MNIKVELIVIWLVVITVCLGVVILKIKTGGEMNPRCSKTNELPETFYIQNGDQTIAFLGCRINKKLTN